MDKKLRKFWLLSEGIIELAKNKKTTKILQSEIMVAPFETINLVVHKVLDDLQGILFHKYGNYFLSVLISACNCEQRILILNSLKGHFLDACFNIYGMHPIQAILSRKLSETEETIIRTLIKGKLLSLSLVYK